MAWSKIKQNMEGFLSPALAGKVEYGATGYRYLPDKPGRCYIIVDKKEILNMKAGASLLPGYQNEQEIKNDPDLQIPVGKEDLEKVRRDMGEAVPEERLEAIARDRKR